MITLTKEWLLKTIAELEEERDAVPGAVNEDAANALAAMKLALASLESGGEAECQHDWSFGGLNKLQSQKQCVKCGHVELVAPPAPVSVPDAIHSQGEKSASNDYYALGWNACRAAMLQGAENAETPTTMQTAPALDSSPKIAESPSGNSPVIPDCWCRTCRPVVLNDMRFVVCPDCGNKRCPRANDHKNSCTGSNEPGQEGSAYPAPRRR
ncbi:hypothetical protein [Enterobacter hormaechei]|uniref:hypothetical protein n=1 Tax=Enterobacter hormaechei TaxID=158836 RepID=UPI0009B2A51A|nr:hypothetical protein [Enterobacter hormaechei]